MVQIISLLALLAWHVDSLSSHLITNVLLPSKEPALFPFPLDFDPKGCWHLVRNPETDAEDFEDENESLVIVKPTLGEEKECFVQFELSLTMEKSQGMRSLFFENVLNPQEPFRRIDVHVNSLASLEFVTTTKRLEIGEQETLTVIGKDGQQNVFSSLQGLHFDFSLQHSDIVQFGEQAVRFNTVSVRGEKTGRSLVYVSLTNNRLKTEVELIVSRSVNICPGEVLTLTKKPTEDFFSFCLFKKRGCFSKSNQEFFLHYSENSTTNTIQVSVLDKLEPTNRATALVHISTMDMFHHFVAPFPSVPFEVLQDKECAFVRSTKPTWPVLSKHLPRESAFQKNLPHYYLSTNTKWIFMSLAKMRNDQYLPLHVMPEVKFTVENPELLSVVQHDFHSTTVLATSQVTGTTRVTMVNNDDKKKTNTSFLVTVLGPLFVLPLKTEEPHFRLEKGCTLDVTIKGGSGHYRSSIPSAFYNLDTIRLPLTTTGGKTSMSVWDGMHMFLHQQLVEVSYVIVPSISMFAFQQGHRITVKAGDLFSLDVSSVPRVDCCNTVQGESLHVDESFLLFFPGVEKPSFDTCGRFRLQALHRTGITRVRFGQAEIEVEIVVPVEFSPPSGISLLVNTKRQLVQVLNLPQQAWVESAVDDGNSYFQVSCGPEEGKFERQVVILPSKEVKHFVYHCVKPVSCQVGLFAQKDQVTQTFVETHVRDLTVQAILFGGVPIQRLFNSYDDVMFAVNGTQLTNTVLPTHVPGSFLVSATVPRSVHMECAPLQITVSERLQPLEPHLFWADGCTVHQVLLRGGSGSFSSSQFDVSPRLRHIVIPPHDADADYRDITVTDENFYPLVQQNVHVWFQTHVEVELFVDTPHVLKNHAVVLHARIPSHFRYEKEDLHVEIVNGEETVSQTKEQLEWTFVPVSHRTVHVVLFFSSPCNKDKKLTKSKQILVHTARKVSLLPGTMYPLSPMCVAHELKECRIVTDLSSSSSSLGFAITSNGTASASCAMSPVNASMALVQCQAGSGLVYFDLEPTQYTALDLFPGSGNGYWMQSNTRHQVHFQLKVSTEDMAEEDRCPLNTDPNLLLPHQWTVSVSQHPVDIVYTSASLYSVWIQTPEFENIVHVAASVKLASYCPQHQQHTTVLKHGESFPVRHFPVLLQPPLSSSSLVLLPTNAVFSVEASLRVTCELSCSKGQQVRLDKCEIHTGQFPATCTLSVLFMDHVFAVLLVEVLPLHSVSLAYFSGLKLRVAFHDEFAREFTVGWRDDTQESRHLQLELPSSLQFLSGTLNCSMVSAGQDLQLALAPSASTKSFRRQLTQENWIQVRVVNAKSNVLLRAMTFVLAKEWQCLGKNIWGVSIWGAYYCLSLYEVLVMGTLFFTLMVLAAQKQHGAFVSVALMLVGIFLWRE